MFSSDCRQYEDYFCNPMPQNYKTYGFRSGTQGSHNPVCVVVKKHCVQEYRIVFNVHCLHCLAEKNVQVLL